MDSNGRLCIPILQTSSQAKESQQNSAECSVEYPGLRHEFHLQKFFEAPSNNFHENVYYPSSLRMLSQGSHRGLVGNTSGSSSSTSTAQGANPRGRGNASHGKEKHQEEHVRALGNKTNTTSSNRSSIYRGVTRYGNNICEAFLWDSSKLGKAKSVYVGGFISEEEAARAHDKAALKYWGKYTRTNFPLSDYKEDLKEMQGMTRSEYLISIRRKSKGFAKGASSYRGVCRNSDYKKWQARLGRGRGIKSIYLGSFSTEEEAARAYDIAAIRLKGLKAITNFSLSQYDVKTILESEKLPIGKGVSSLLKKYTVDDILNNRGDMPTALSSSPSEISSIYSFISNPQIMQMQPEPMRNKSIGLDHQNYNQLLPLNQNSMCQRVGMDQTDQENSLDEFWMGIQPMQMFEQLPTSVASDLHPTRVMQQNLSSLYPLGYQNPNLIQTNPNSHYSFPSIGSEEQINIDEYFSGGLSSSEVTCQESMSDNKYGPNQNPTSNLLHYGYQNPTYSTTFLEELTGTDNGSESNGNISEFFDGDVEPYPNDGSPMIGVATESNEDGVKWDSDVDMDEFDIDPNLLRELLSDDP